MALIIIIFIGTLGFLFKEGYISLSGTEENNSDNLSAEVAAKANNEKSEVETEEAEINSSNSFVDINGINSSMLGQTIKIRGEITEKQTHNEGHVFLTLTNENVSILIPIFKDKNIDSTLYEKGEMIEVSGKVQAYKGSFEIVPSQTEDIVLIEDDISGVIVITKNYIGEQITIEGQVLARYEHPEGHLFLTLSLNNGQEIEVPIFNSKNPNINNYQLNSKLLVKGEVNEYKGDLQVIPDSLEDIQELEEGETSTVTTQELDAIKESDRGKKVIIEGEVDNVSVSNKGHVFFTLVEGSNKLQAVLFEADSKENMGRRERIIDSEEHRLSLRIEGAVEVYKDELTIVVDKVLID